MKRRFDWWLADVSLVEFEIAVTEQTMSHIWIGLKNAV
jgi:hypothetical protein